MQFDEETKNKLLKACVDIQTLTFRGKTADEIFDTLVKQGHKPEHLAMALDLLIASQQDDRSPFKKLTEALTECMETVDGKFDGLKSTKEFYSIIRDLYLNVIMNKKDLEGMPICFMYNKDTKPHVGVVPMQGRSDQSPLDGLKQLVYASSPDAYIFCGEASMKAMNQDEIKDYKYGYLESHPESKDVIAITGNNKAGNESFAELYNMKQVNDKWEFELIPDKNNSCMESEKLP